MDDERNRFETVINGLREEISRLQKRYQESTLDKLGGQDLSAQKMRSEFRKLMTVTFHFIFIINLALITYYLYIIRIFEMNTLIKSTKK
jgi:uncharacterized membrane protein (DUF106 family)